MAKYRTYRALGPALVLTYATTALLASQYNGREVFPFFNWALFPSASNPKHDVVMVVRAIDGKPLARPTLFFEMPHRFAAAKAQDIRMAKTLDRLASAVARGDAEGERAMRSTVERIYLRDADSIEYDLATIRYHPIERYSSGTIERMDVLRSYKKQ